VRAKRPKEDLGGEQSPWKDRASPRRKRRGTQRTRRRSKALKSATPRLDSRAWRSGNGRLHRRARSSPAPGHPRGGQGRSQRAADVQIGSPGSGPVRVRECPAASQDLRIPDGHPLSGGAGAASAVLPLRRESREGEGLRREGQPPGGFGREATSRWNGRARARSGARHSGATAAPRRGELAPTAPTSSRDWAPASGSPGPGARRPHALGERIGASRCEAARGEWNGRRARAAVTRYGCWRGEFFEGCELRRGEGARRAGRPSGHGWRSGSETRRTP